MAERTIEIQRADWSQALNAFSATHEGWLFSLEILSPTMGAQPEFIDLPLLGVTFEAGDGGTITITAAQAAFTHVTHTIRAPSHVWIERTETGADAAVDVESPDGTKAILRFKTPALPETVDGVAQWP
jgi:hypothetical protein